MRPLVHDPRFNVVVSFEKKVGLINSKTATVEATFSKNFYLAGEMAYFVVKINNTMCSDACNLIISHKSMVRMDNN